MALHLLVEEQIILGHICSSTSLWDTLVFVIQKASGAWCMLQDLCKINERLEVVGTPLRGMPWTPTILSEYTLVVIDIQDCFFSILLHLNDCEKFAFSIPFLNFSQPDQRFQ